ELDAGVVSPRPGKLLVREANRRDLAALPGEMVCQRAPATADLEQRPGLAEPLRQPLPLAPLRGLQPVRTQPIAARITHRRVEPDAVEVVAEIVVRVDVPFGLYAGVAVEPVQGAARSTPWALGAARLAEARRV